jgi:hypothetical protein
LVVIPPEAVSERPANGGTPSGATADVLRCGALKLPRLRSRLARDLTWRHAAAPSTLARALVAVGVLALILIGGVMQFRAQTVEHREPPLAVDSIETWLRNMTITRAPANSSPLAVPDRL